jgi:hypothetical protein
MRLDVFESTGHQRSGAYVKEKGRCREIVNAKLSEKGESFIIHLPDGGQLSL